MSRAVLALVSGLLFWSLVPSALGWHPTVVMTGSMEPRLHPGDIVISRAVPPQQLRIGQVLLVKDPDHHGRLRLHRFVGVRPDGSLTLKGDANPSADSTPVTPSAVLGVASLRIPALGKAVLWAQDGNYLSLASACALAALLVAGAFAYRSPVEDATLGDPPVDDPRDDDHPPIADDRSGESPRRNASGRWASRGAAALTVLAIVTGFQAVHPAAAHAATFGGIHTNSGNTWGAVPYFTCRAAVLANTPYLYYRLNEASGTTATDSSGNSRDGAYRGTAPTFGVTGPCTRDSSNAVTLNGTNSYVSTASQVTNPTIFTVESWFKTTTTKGGMLIGLGDAKTGASTTTDRHLYLDNAGHVLFGVSPGGTKKTITTTTTYNDGSWHLADATLSAAGMTLYLDGHLAASDSTTTTANNFSGYWRVGYDTLTGWTGAPTSNFYAGSLADAAVYTTALTASQIAGHYTAS